MSAVHRVGHLRHLAVRFLTSLDPRGPAADEVRWAHAHLLDGERALWDRMSGPDRRHSAAVARRTVDLLGGDADRAVVAAALLHDVGKVDAGLGTFARVAATVAAGAAGRQRTERWRGRIGRYLAHDRIGADLLEAAGSAPITSAWARQHHLPPARWTLDPRVARALKDADDD